MRRALGIVVLVALGAGIALVLHRLAETRDVHGSPTVEFTTTRATTPRPTRAPLAWPMFGRDPSRTAVGAGVRPPFRRVWAAGGRALIEFPPVVAYGRLYYTDGGGRVYAVSATTGRRAWRYDARRGSAASPAVGAYAHGTVYAAFLNRFPADGKDPHDGAVVALAAGTGRVRWVAHVGASETSPLLLDGRVYVGGWDGVVYALDARDGRRLWTYATHGPVKGGLAAGTGVVYAGSYDGHLYALAAVTGRLRWRASGQPAFFHHGAFYATPAVAYGRVYVGSTDGRVYSFGARSGRLRWSHRTGGYVYGSAAVWDGLVLAGSYDHHLYAFDAATGDVRWRFDAGGPISGSTTVIGGVAYAVTLEGHTLALDARTGRLLWSRAGGKYAPAVSDGKRVYLVGNGAVDGFRSAR
jgi:outer membrane protein assembly factor BamB